MRGFSKNAGGPGVGMVLGAILLLSGCKDASQQPSTARPTEATVNPGGAQGQMPANSDEFGRRSRRSRRGRPNAQAAPGEFDFYLLNLSWSPEFCATHGNSQECGHGLGFVVHGLWPQDVSGDYPEDCGDAPGPSNPQAYTDLIPTVSLIQHEWQTHGTCSGLAADAYFGEIRKARGEVKIPAGIGSGGDASGGDASGVEPAQLIGRLQEANPSFPQGSIALSCGNNRLTAVEVCLSKSLQPEACQGVRSCRANSIRITPQ